MQPQPLRIQLQQIIYKIINPFVRLLIKLGLTPNGVTIIGFVLNIGVACIFIFGAEEGQRADLSYVGWAGALVLFAGLFDMLDGQVARLGGMSSSFGALFDSVLDRYSELVTFLGICYYLVAHHYFFSSLFAFIALIGSMMVSYTRARAEGLGIECKDGLMQRPERVVLVGITAMLCGIITHYVGDFKLYLPGTSFHLLENISIFTLPLTVMAIMTNITAFNRLITAKKTLEARDAIKKTETPVKYILPIVAIVVLLSAFQVPINQQKPVAKIIEAQDTFPVPKQNSKLLFYLQRTPNTNTIVYELNEDAKGQLIKDEPIIVHWLRFAEDGAKKELSYIQRVFAYGIKTEKVTDTTYQMHINSYRKKPLYLMRHKSDNKYHMFALINARIAMLKRVFIRIDPGGSFWKPNVIYIEMKGIDVATGKEAMERFKV